MVTGSEPEVDQTEGAVVVPSVRIDFGRGSRALGCSQSEMGMPIHAAGSVDEANDGVDEDLMSLFMMLRPTCLPLRGPGPRAATRVIWP